MSFQKVNQQKVISFNNIQINRPEQDEKNKVKQSPLKEYMQRQGSNQQLYFDPTSNLANIEPIEEFDENVKDEEEEKEKEKEEEQISEKVEEPVERDYSLLKRGIKCYKFGNNTLLRPDSRRVLIVLNVRYIWMMIWCIFSGRKQGLVK